MENLKGMVMGLKATVTTMEKEIEAIQGQLASQEKENKSFQEQLEAKEKELTDTRQ